MKIVLFNIAIWKIIVHNKLRYKEKENTSTYGI